MMRPRQPNRRHDRTEPEDGDLPEQHCPPVVGHREGHDGTTGVIEDPTS